MKKRSDSAIAHVVKQLETSLRREYYDDDKEQLRMQAFVQWCETIMSEKADEVVNTLPSLRFA
jgi:hypothetical protein